MSDLTPALYFQFVGKVTSFNMPLSKDNVFFGVQVDKDGNVSVASYPVPGR